MSFLIEIVVAIAKMMLMMAKAMKLILSSLLAKMIVIA